MCSTSRYSVCAFVNNMAVSLGRVRQSVFGPSKQGWLDRYVWETPEPNKRGAGEGEPRGRSQNADHVRT